MVEVEITNEVINTLQQETAYSMALAISSVIIAVITAITLGLSYKHTRDQLFETRKERMYRTRPILARHVHEKIIYDSTQLNYDTYSLNHSKIMLHMINNGTIPAVKISKKFYVEKFKKFEKPRLDPTDESDSISMSDLAPTEYYSVDIPWIKDDFIHATTSTDLYFGIIIWYHDEEMNKYFYHLEGHFQAEALMLDHVKLGTLKHNLIQ